MSRTAAMVQSAAQSAAVPRLQENASSKRLFFDLFAILALAALARLAFFFRSAGDRRNRLSHPRSTYSPLGVSTGGLHRRHARRDQHFSCSFDISIRDRNRRRERVVLRLLAGPSSSCLRLRL